MTRVYRLLRKPFATSPFNGEGSYRYGGRWSGPGVHIAYTSEHLSLAMLEYLVHLDAENPPADLVLAQAEIPESLPRTRLEEAELPRGWRRYPTHEKLREIGSQFVAEARTAILIMPSAIAPAEYNWLLNPEHPDFQQINLLTPVPFAYGPLLLK